MRAYLEKQLADLILSLCCRLVQWSKLPQVHDIDVGTVLDQQVCHLVVAIGTGVVQGNQPTGRDSGGKRISTGTSL